MRLERVAFMSYAHENDRIDDGYLSKFRERLQGQITAALGEDFVIFQDRVHIAPGHLWRERVERYLSESTFLMPILTPHFFKSDWCRKEFEYFREVERKTRIGPRIIPIYYIECREMRDHATFAPDSMERLLASYQYADWRQLRDRRINSSSATRQMRRIARHLLDRLDEFESGQPSASAPLPLGEPRTSWSLHASTGDSLPGTPFDFQMLPFPKRIIGRSSEISQVIELLTTPSGSHIVSIDGIDAIGKTTVTAAAIRQLYDLASFPDGIAVVLCTGMTDPLTVLRDALTRFDSGRRPPAMRDEVALIQEAHRLLDKKQALVVLDDVESALDIRRVVEPLHEAGVALLLTSKKRLHLPQAASFTLRPLRKPDALDLLTNPYEDER